LGFGRKLKTCRKHTDDFVGTILDSHGAPEGRRPGAEIALGER